MFMWPFKRTLSVRYSKLVKLIKSIDSHFQLTEDKEDSLRLHLPNYKGNQTMDFQIYLLEPFLYISFTTEIDGEKVKCLSNYHQDIDQQDMFNDAMARNLNKVHEVLGKKYKEDDDFVNKNGIEKPEFNPTIINSWPLLTFAKEHGKMQVGDFQNKETGEMFKACIFTQTDGTRVFVAFSSKLGELTPKEIAAMKDELVVVQLESGNYSLCKRDTTWEDIDL